MKDAAMRDERLANEAALLASTAVGTGIDTIPIPTGASSGPGTVGVNYGQESVTFTPSSDFDATTGEIFGGGNTYGAMQDGSQLIRILGPGRAALSIKYWILLVLLYWLHLTTSKMLISLLTAKVA